MKDAAAQSKCVRRVTRRNTLISPSLLIIRCWKENGGFFPQKKEKRKDRELGMTARGRFPVTVFFDEFVRATRNRGGVWQDVQAIFPSSSGMMRRLGEISVLRLVTRRTHFDLRSRILHGVLGVVQCMATCARHVTRRVSAGGSNRGAALD